MPATFPPDIAGPLRAHEDDPSAHGVDGVRQDLTAEIEAREALELSVEGGGVFAGETDGVDSRALVVPQADDENGFTFKRPSADWGVGQPYGKGQVFELLKDAADPTDIGYTGETLTDLVLLRVSPDASLGLGGNIHLATGLRQPAGYDSGYALFIEPFVDTQHIVMKGVAGQAEPFMRVADSNASDVFRLNPNGNGRFGMVANAGGMVIGDIGAGGASYFGIAHNLRASSAEYALSQGSGGDTLVNAAAGQTVTLRVANVARLTVANTLVTVAAGLRHTGSQLGFYNAPTVAKPTGVAVTAAGIHAALVSLGLIAA